MEGPKFLHTLFDKYLDQMLVKFEQNRIARNIQNFESFGKKWLTNFGRRSCNINNYLMLKYYSKEYHLSLMQKLWQSDTCNQVKSCTKHGRSNQLQRKHTVALTMYFIYLHSLTRIFNSVVLNRRPVCQILGWPFTNIEIQCAIASFRFLVKKEELEGNKAENRF